MQLELRKRGRSILTILLISLVTGPTLAYFVGSSHAAANGLFIVGTDNNDATQSALVTTFLGWLRQYTCRDLTVVKTGEVTDNGAIANCPTFASTNVFTTLVQSVVNNANNAKVPTTINVGGQDAQIMVDRYDRRLVDSADIAQFPDPPAAGQTSDRYDRGQVIAHVVGEYYWAAQQGWTSKDGMWGFQRAHKQGGMTAEASVRSAAGGTGTHCCAPEATPVCKLNGGAGQQAQGAACLVPPPPGMKRAQITDSIVHFYGAGANPPETYRETITLAKPNEWNIGNIAVSAVPNPAPKAVADPIGSELNFVGQVVSIDEPLGLAPSGFEGPDGLFGNVQNVTYTVETVQTGTYPVGQQIVVYHSIGDSSDDTVDAQNVSRLGSQFTIGSRWTVDAFSLEVNSGAGIPIYASDEPITVLCPSVCSGASRYSFSPDSDFLHLDAMAGVRFVLVVRDSRIVTDLVWTVQVSGKEVVIRAPMSPNTTRWGLLAIVKVGDQLVTPGLPNAYDRWSR